MEVKGTYEISESNDRKGVTCSIWFRQLWPDMESTELSQVIPGIFGLGDQSIIRDKTN